MSSSQSASDVYGFGLPGAHRGLCAAGPLGTQEPGAGDDVYAISLVRPRLPRRNAKTDPLWLGVPSPDLDPGDGLVGADGVLDRHALFDHLGLS